MTLLALMYHRACEGPHGNAPEVLDAHFEYLAKHYRCVLPGEPLDRGRLNVCITFDDAYSDLHSTVIPLLGRYGLRALVAVSPGFVEPVSIGKSGLSRRPRDHCNWPQLEQALSSGCIEIAAQGLNHVPLDGHEVDLRAEIVAPKVLLAERLGRPVRSFVLPFGTFTPASLEFAKYHYKYVFRTGDADNTGWGAEAIYRIDANRMAAPDSLFTKPRLRRYRLRRYWNFARGL